MDEPIERLSKHLAQREADARNMLARWKRAIEGLTPSGSEFVDDPEYCAAYIRKRTEYPSQIITLRKQVAELQDAADVARGLALREAARRIRRISDDYHDDGPTREAMARTVEEGIDLPAAKALAAHDAEVGRVARLSAHDKQCSQCGGVPVGTPVKRCFYGAAMERKP